MKMVTAVVTKAGGREVNTDALVWQDNGDTLGCWVVADGRGGPDRGPGPARLAAKSLLNVFMDNPAISPNILSSAFEWAQRDMFNLQDSQGSDKTLRASAALFCTGGRSALWGHIGNVRVYVFRDGAVIAQTLDHSAPQGMVKAGELDPEEVRGHAEHHRLLRSLGSPGMPRPSILAERFLLKPGDLFLICTDGFWERVTEGEMLVDWCKSANVQQWLEHMEVRLLKSAPQGHDCYSAIALLAEP